MTPGVEGDGVVAGGAEGLAGPLPGVAGLAAAVLQQHQRTVRIPPGVPGDDDAVGALPGVHRVGRTR